MYGVCYMMEKFDTKILNSVHAAHNQAQKEFYPPQPFFTGKILYMYKMIAKFAF